jgi:hypothetical protein
MPSLGLLVIATGRYLEFADMMITDLEAVADTEDIVVNLFNDANAGRLRRLQDTHRVRVNSLPVPELRWPEASLYRYELFAGAASAIGGEHLVYLDADLRVRRDFTSLVTPESWPGGLAAVRHPGYYRPRQIRPRGTWETRRGSRAYVPPFRRRRYVCGGVWAGARSALLAMSEELAGRVRQDVAAGVTARWHDESHWNWWVAHHPVELLDPSWCHVPDYPWLSGLDPLIVAVDKGADFAREQTTDAVRRAVTDGQAPFDGGR